MSHQSKGEHNSIYMSLSSFRVLALGWLLEKYKNDTGSQSSGFYFYCRLLMHCIGAFKHVFLIINLDYKKFIFLFFVGYADMKWWTRYKPWKESSDLNCNYFFLETLEKVFLFLYWNINKSCHSEVWQFHFKVYAV